MEEQKLYEPIIPSNPVPEEIRKESNLNITFPIDGNLSKYCDLHKIFEYVFDDKFLKNYIVASFRIHILESDEQRNVLIIQLNGCSFTVAAIIVATMVKILLMCDKYMNDKSQIIVGSTFFFIKQDFENRIKQLC